MCPGSGWVRASKHATVGKHPNSSQAPHLWSSVYIVLAKKRYQAVGFPFNRMLKLSSSRGIRIDVPVLSVSWSCEDHSVNIKALRKGPHHMNVHDISYHLLVTLFNVDMIYQQL